MSINVNEFEYVPGKNDAEYIKLLKGVIEMQKNTIGKAVAKVKKLSAQTRWIPCSERMPEIGKDVLTTYIDGEMKRCYVREDAWFPNDDSEKSGWINEESDYRYNGLSMEVIAWMPMPEPYKEDEDGSERKE